MIDIMLRKREEKEKEIVYVEFNIKGRRKRIYRKEGSGGVDYLKEEG